MRSIPHSSVHTLPFSSPQYIDSVASTLYSSMNNKYSPATTLGAYTSPPVSQSANYFPVDSHNQLLSKLGSQVYSKPDSYYPTNKSHYSNIPDKPHTVHVTSHYTVGKVLVQQQDPYYTSSPHSTPARAKYETEKITSSSTATPFYPPQGLSTGSLKQDVHSSGPKSTLYYGPQETTFLPTPASNIPYQMTVPKPQESSNTYVRETVNKLPERPIANRPYPGGHVSPHLPYSDLYKGSHLQQQIFSSVPAQISPSHVDYNSYKPAAEPVPSVNLHVEGNHTVRQYPLEYTCHVCQLPCSNSHELSEHMKIHAMAQSASLPHFVPQSTTVSGSYSVSEPSLKHHASPENNFASSTSSFSVYNSKDNLTSMKMTYLEEHKKSQVNLLEYQYHCKTCDKFFSSSAKYKRHESQHKRNASYLYCEFCMASFEQKGHYLHHMTKKHGPPHASTNIVESSGKHSHNVTESSGTSSSSSLLVDLVNIVDCQICDLEVYRDKLVEHLSTHPLFMCRICDGMFVQNSELVEHLMKQHSKELERSDSNRNNSEKGKVVQSGASNIVVQRVKLDEEDSGLEEDKDEETREPMVKTAGPKNVDTGETSPAKCNNETIVKEKTCEELNVSDAKTDMKDDIDKNQFEKGIKRKSIPVDESNENVKKVKKVEMKNLKENLQKKVEEDKVKVVSSNKELVKDDESTSVSDITKSEDNDIPELGISRKKLKFRCSKCDKSFAKHGDLVQHVEVHNKDPNRIYCEVCDLSYHIKEKGYYMYHMKYHKDVEMVNSHHPAQLPCVVCNKEIKKQVLVSHIVNQHTQFSCDICQWSYSSEKSLLTHMKRIHGQKYKQLKDMKKVVKEKPLPVVYRKLKELKAEEQAESNSKEKNKQDEQAAKVTYTCDVCSKTLVSKSFFEKHVLKHKLTAEEQQEACDLCQLTFPSKGTYFFHILKDHTKSIISESQGQSDKHIKSNEGEGFSFQSCTESQMENVNNSQTQRVTQIVRTVLNPETGFFEEKLVDEPETEMNVTDKLNEKSAGEMKIERTDLKDKVNVKDVIYCKLCNRSLNKSGLLDHMESHTFYHCEACKFTYTKLKPYLHHIKVLHVEQFIESEIEKSKMLEKTPTDKRRRSETTKLVSCPLCSGEFRQNSYVDHLKTHLPQSWTCQFCSRQFSKKKLLAIHEKSHERICHSSLPYPMFCPSCNAAINSRQTYIEHMCGHLKKTPFKCKFCDEKFLYEKGGDCHMKIQHCTNGRIFWKVDGDGVKFDVRTGRITEVTSDYITEIREINDLMKLNGKPEIWISSPQKKKDKLADSYKWKSTDDESDERLKTDTSDDEYTPGTRMSLRKKAILNDKSSSDDNDDDSSDSSDDSSDDDSTDDSSDESSSDDDSSEGSEDGDKDEKRDKEVEVSTSSQPKHNTAEVFAGSESENEIHSPRTRSRQQARKNSSEIRRSPRIKPSKVTGTRSSPRTAAQKAKLNESDKKQETVKRKSVESERTTRTRRAKAPRTSISKTDEDVTVKTPSKCPCCSQRFTSERNLNNHIKSSHKSYRARKERLSGNLHGTPASGRLRTRTKNLRSDLTEPCSSSTPIRQGRAIVKISPLILDDSEGKPVKISSPVTGNKRFKYYCPYCRKGFSHSKWNFSRHVNTHKKDKGQQGGERKDTRTSKEVDENKPFSCKVCSESFQKKRDLYIHAKKHSGEQADDSVTSNGEVKDVSSALENNADSSMNTTNSSDNSTVNISQGDSVLELRSDVKSDNNLSKTVEQSHSNVDISDKHEKVTNDSVGKQKEVHEIVENAKGLQDKNVDKISDQELKVGNDVSNISKPVSDQKELPKSKGEVSTNTEVHSVNNNGDVNNKEENDTEERSKVTRTIPPKMSAEAALAKWKSKVAATLSSQLELHATKLKQELENPEAAKVKEFLSKSGKTERRSLECRICGDMFQKEDKFREHMNIHLNQSPPYCGLCNMYFMAIYPIRRLLEHNKKKHPDLVKTVTSEKPC